MSPGTGHGDDLDEGGFDALESAPSSADIWASHGSGIAEAGPEETERILRMPPPPGREDRRYLWVIAVVAALFLITGTSIGLLATAGDDGEVVPLAGTDLAPAASATARLEKTSQGLRVLMSIEGLPPAEPGTYYQGWIRNETDGVAIGTFHLRGGDGEVELLAGVLPHDYPTVMVTLQQEGEGPGTSGQVVLRGDVGE